MSYYHLDSICLERFSFTSIFIFKTVYLFAKNLAMKVHPKHVKVVLQGSPKWQDSHDLSECHRLYDLGRRIEEHHLPALSLTVSTLTPKNP